MTGACGPRSATWKDHNGRRTLCGAPASYVVIRYLEGITLTPNVAVTSGCSRTWI